MITDLPLNSFLEKVAFFNSKIIIEKAGCWRWLGQKTMNGYGKIGFGQRKTKYAHRFSYSLFREEIPHPLVIDHLCKNRLCVNPDHLEVVTLGENSRRGGWHLVSNGNRSKMTHCLRGHEFNALNTYYDKKNHRYCRVCSRMRKRGQK